MTKNNTTSAIVDEVIRFTALTTAIGGAVVLPGLAPALEKPLGSLITHLDKRRYEREVRRIVYGMKDRGLLVGDYEHGLQLTVKAKRRLARIEVQNLSIKVPDTWDARWRIIFYDIPEKHASARRHVVQSLRDLGCFQLQKSVWITPFECRDVIEVIAVYYGVSSFVSYVKSEGLDNEAALIKRFQRKYPDTSFSPTY